MKAQERFPERLTAKVYGSPQWDPGIFWPAPGQPRRPLFL